MTIHIGAQPGEIAETVLMPGDPYRAKWAAERFLDNPVCVNQVRGMLGFTGTWRGNRVTIQGSGMGMPSLSIYANELIRDYGAKTLIRIGSAGAMQQAVALHDVVIAMTASSLSTPSSGILRELNSAPCADWTMLSAAASGERLTGELRVGVWQILLLNSQVPGEVGGRLGPGDLDRLQRALVAARDASLHTLVCLHHQPVPVGCEWLDEQMVEDADALLSSLRDFAGVKGVLWGHVHQEIDRQWEGVRLLASPSTCVQFAPGSKGFRADDQPPGYRWLDLHDNGHIATGVSRVTDVTFYVDLESGGYL